MTNDMMKDSTIEQRFREYFAGAQLPEIDLSAAKRALSEKPKRSRRFYATLTSILSAAACLILTIALLVNYLPMMNVYSLADAATSATSYTEISQNYEAAEMFAPFSLASNADAEYTVYTAKGREVLLRADLDYIGGNVRFTATVYIDLTDGKLKAKELKDYKDLSERGSGYRYETEYVNGEYVSKAYCVIDESRCFIDVSSHSDQAVSLLMKMLRS